MNIRLYVDDNDLLKGNYGLFNIECENGEPMHQMVSIDNVNILWVIGSGSAVSILPYATYEPCYKDKHSIKSHGA